MCWYYDILLDSKVVVVDNMVTIRKKLIFQRKQNSNMGDDDKEKEIDQLKKLRVNGWFLRLIQKIQHAYFHDVWKPFLFVSTLP